MRLLVLLTIKPEPIAGPIGVKATTQMKVLLFDPDPVGRQQSQTVFKRDASDIRLTIRARQESFIRCKRSFRGMC